MANGQSAAPPPPPPPPPPFSAPPPSFAEDPLIGRQLGGYQIDSFIADGAMGRVYRGRQLSLDRPVAIKVLHPALAEDQEFVARFFNEAHAAARVTHPNCVEVHDFGQANGTFYFVMELVNGQSLGDYLDRGEAFSERECVEIARETLMALQAAHAAGIVHRDVKPDNLMLTAEGVVKLSDLGLAQSRGAWSVTTNDINMASGTPCYRSPEQAYGATNIDYRSDFYSVGATLFHLATGRLPFLDHTPEAIFRRQTTHAPPDPRAVNPAISESFANLVRSLMAPDPALRPQTHADIFTALQVCDEQVCKKTHHTSRITTSGAEPLEPRSLLGKLTPWLVGAGALAAIGLGLLAIRHKPAEPSPEALLGSVETADKPQPTTTQPKPATPPAPSATLASLPADVGYQGPPIKLARPNIPGRLVVWPLFKDVTRHDGVGTLPDALKEATDVVAIAAFWLNDSRRFDGPSGSAIALRSDGSVTAWGAAPTRFGDPDWTQPPADLANVVGVSIASYAVALKDNGDVVAWGHPKLTRPRVFAGFLRVTAGIYGWVGIRPDGKLMQAHSTRDFALEPADDTGRFIDVTAGQDHYLALREDGSVKGWACSTSVTSSNAAQIPDDLNDVCALDATYSASFALTAEGRIRVWGPDTPSKAEDFLDVVRVRTGKCHNMSDTIAILDGSGHWFFMGGGTLDVPTCETMSEGCIDIAFAGDHAVGLKIDDVKAAIRAERDAERERRSLFAFSPTAPLPPEPATPKPAAAPTVATGPALRLGRPQICGRVIAWPLYKDAKTREGLGTLPPEVAGTYDICAIAARKSNEGDVSRPQGVGIALRTNGSVIAWGQLEGGKSPQPPPEVADAVAIDVSPQDCFALKADGTAFRWDRPDSVAEQLSDTVSLQAASDNPACFAFLRSGGTAFLGKTGHRNMWPQDFFESPTRWIAVGMTIPQHGMVALRAEGTVVYWGDSKGAPPHDLASVKSIIAGHSHVYAIRHDGSLFRWGRDDPGGVVATHPSVRRIRARLTPSYYRTSNQRGSITAFQNREGKWSFEASDDFDAEQANQMSANCIDLAFGSEYAIGLKVDDLPAAIAAEDSHEQKLFALLGVKAPAPTVAAAATDAPAASAATTTGAVAVAAAKANVFTEDEAAELQNSLAPLRDALDGHAKNDDARIAQYLKELEALENRIAARADLDATVAIRSEREAWQAGQRPQKPPAATKLPPEYSRLRYAIDRDLADSDNRLDYQIKNLSPRAVQALKALEAKLTRTTHLTAALAVREITERVQKNEFPAALASVFPEASPSAPAVAATQSEEKKAPVLAAKASPALAAGASATTPADAASAILPIPERPTRQGRVVAWPLYRDVDSPEGLGTLPPELASATNIVAIAAAAANDTVRSGPQGVGLALRTDGAVIAWGVFHELKDPKPPDDLANVVAIECSKRYGYAITSAGELALWGTDNKRLKDIARICPSEIGDSAFVIDRFGKIAMGTSQALQSAPKELPPVIDVRYSTASHGCVLLAPDGIPICCGDARGSPPKNLDPIVAMRTAHRATLGLTAKGKCVVWGTSPGEIPDAEEVSKVRSARRLCGRFVPAHYSTAKPRGAIIAIQEESGKWRWFCREPSFDEKTCEKMSKDCIDIAFGAEHAIGLKIED